MIDLILSFKSNNPDLFLTYLKLFFSLIFFIFFYNFINFLKISKLHFSKSFFILIIIFIISIDIFFTGNNNAYNWLSNYEIPLIKFDLDNEYLKNDFYINSQYDTLKFIFARFINLLNIFQIRLDFLYFTFQILVIYLSPILSFLILTNFGKNSKFYLYENTSLSISLSFIFSLGYLTYLQKDTGFDSFSAWNFFNPLSLSNLLCLYLFYSIQKNGYLKIFNYFLLGFATLIHPVTGIFFFILIYILLNKYEIFSIKNLFLINLDKLLLSLSLIVPIFFIFFLYENNSYLSDLDHINIYIYFRHPHHYLISSFFSYHTIFWTILILFFVFIFYIKNNRKAYLLSIYLSIIIIGCISIHFIFSEIYLNKIISSKISPIRFFSYVLFIYIILVNILFDNKSNQYFFKTNKKKSLITICIFILLVSFSSFNEKEILHRIPDASELIQFIKNKNEINYIYSDYESEWILSYARSYSGKAVYVDNLYIFNDKKVEEWYLKYQNGNKIRNLNNTLNVNKFICSLNDLGIDSYIMSVEKGDVKDNFENKDVFFKNQSYKILDIKKIAIKRNC